MVYVPHLAHPIIFAVVAVKAAALFAGAAVFADEDFETYPAPHVTLVATVYALPVIAHAVI